MEIRYYITESENWDAYLPNMAAAVGNPRPRYSLDNELVVMKFASDNVPEGYVAPEGYEQDGYSRDIMPSVLDTLKWTPEPSEGGEI